MIEVTASALADHPFLHGMPREHLDVLAQAASDITLPARHRIFQDGGHARRFWLIRSGRVALNVQMPGEGPMVIETIGMGEQLGWSWMFPAFDAAAVRDRCAADPAPGYEVTRRVARVLAKRLRASHDAANRQAWGGEPIVKGEARDCRELVVGVGPRPSCRDQSPGAFGLLARPGRQRTGKACAPEQAVRTDPMNGPSTTGWPDDVVHQGNRQG